MPPVCDSTAEASGFSAASRLHWKKYCLYLQQKQLREDSYFRL